MAKKKEDPKKFKRLSVDEVKEKRITFNRDDELAWASTWDKVRLVSLTESEMTFLSEKPLEMRRIYYVELPLPFYITIVPKKATADYSKLENSYRALIHGIDETTKQKLTLSQQALVPLEKSR